MHLRSSTKYLVAWNAHLSHEDYFKAYCHTATSFLLPDRLTGRKHKIELKTKKDFAVLVYRQDLFELKGFFFILFLSGGRNQVRRQVEGELP